MVAQTAFIKTALNLCVDIYHRCDTENECSALQNSSLFKPQSLQWLIQLCA